MKTQDLGPKPWHERLLDFLEQWRLVTGLVLLAFVVGGGFTLLLMEKLRKPETVVTETREVVEEKIIEEVAEAPKQEPKKVARVAGATSGNQASESPTTDQPKQSAQSPASSPQQSGKVNINTAGSAELDSLKGIGPVLAERIIEYRNANGPFKSIEEIINVKGIGPKTFEKFKDEITI